MINPAVFFEGLTSAGIDFFSGIPDSTLKNLCAHITAHTTSENHIIAANEGTAVSIATGYQMASGKTPLVYMQNSGIGNAVNPLLSLADEMVYKIPMLLVIGWRGEPCVKDEPQHKKQGIITLELLRTMNIPYIVLSSNEKEALIQLAEIIKKTKTESKPCAIIVRQNSFSTTSSKPIIENNYSLSREHALEIVLDCLSENDAIISTTGKLSRELFEYRERNHQSHENDFLTVGSMGHASSIALGIKIAKKDKFVCCLDGDGALLMHLGSITNIGYLHPKNFMHVIFNNGCHESVGAQPTVAFSVDIPSIAKACGYKEAFSAINEQEIKDKISFIKNTATTSLLEIKVNIDVREDLGRPTTTPEENKTAFIEFLKKK